MRKAGKIILWIVAALVTAVIAVFVWRTAAYYRAIKKDGQVDISQFRKEFTPLRQGAAGQAQYSASLETVLGVADDPFLGNPAAQVTIVEFGDFDCPFCRKAFPVMRQIAAEYGDRARFVFRDFPVDELHPRARAAHLAASCAQEQDKFWPYHDKLYQNQERRSDDDFRSFAVAAGIDIGQFDQCAGTQRHASEIDADFKDGLALGVQGTPTWFIVSGGAYEKVEGAIPIEVWRGVINQLVR